VLGQLGRLVDIELDAQHRSGRRPVGDHRRAPQARRRAPAPALGGTLVQPGDVLIAMGTASTMDRLDALFAPKEA
jgi:hypothetical protein